MSVLIKGMEMQTSCEECQFDAGGYCTAKSINFLDWCEVNDRPRPSWCPLVKVPKHGRLIDADCCNDYFYEHMSDDMMIVAMNAINEMPTIIESE